MKIFYQYYAHGREPITTKNYFLHTHLEITRLGQAVSLLSDAECAVGPSSQDTASSESDHSESLVPQDTGLDHEFGNDQDIDGDQDLLTSVDQDQYLNSLALFYLKLQAQFSTAIIRYQNIIEEFQEIHQIGPGHSFSNLQKKLTALGVANTNVSDLWVLPIPMCQTFGCCQYQCVRPF